MIEAGYEYVQAKAPIFNKASVLIEDITVDLVELLSVMRGEGSASGSGPIELRTNRMAAHNRKYLAEAIMERFVAQYRSARPEPHYLFKEVTLIRTLLVVEGIDEEAARDQQVSSQPLASL